MFFNLKFQVNGCFSECGEWSLQHQQVFREFQISQIPRKYGNKFRP